MTLDEAKQINKTLNAARAEIRAAICCLEANSPVLAYKELVKADATLYEQSSKLIQQFPHEL